MNAPNVILEIRVWFAHLRSKLANYIYPNWPPSEREMRMTWQSGNIAKIEFYRGNDTHVVWVVPRKVVTLRISVECIQIEEYTERYISNRIDES